MGEGPRARRGLHPPRLPGAAHRGEGPGQGATVVVYCAGGTRSALAAQRAAGPRLHGRGLAGGRLRALEGGGLPGRRSRARSPPSRRSATAATCCVPEVGEAGQARLLDVEGPAGRRGRARLARRRSTWPRPAWARSGSSTSTSWTSRNLQRQVLHTNASRRAAEDGVGGGHAERAQPRRAASCATTCASTPSNVMDVIAPYDVILDGCDNFTTKYLVNDAAVLARQADRLRQHLPLRRPGLDLRAAAGPVLPLPLPRAHAAGAGALVRRGRRARRAARRGRPHPGHRGDQAAPRQGAARSWAGCSPTTRCDMTFREYKVRARPELRGLRRRTRPSARSRDLEWSCHFEPRPRGAARRADAVSARRSPPRPVLGSILDAIGHTPLVRLRLPGVPARRRAVGQVRVVQPRRLGEGPHGAVARRARASAAARCARARSIIDSSSGNTAVGLALVGRAQGLRGRAGHAGERQRGARRRLCEAYGARIVVHRPAARDPTARSLRCARWSPREPERYFYADQYRNPANPLAHYRTTGPEIWEQTGGRITHFVAGLGTTGTIVGTGRYLHEQSRARARGGGGARRRAARPGGPQAPGHRDRARDLRPGGARREGHGVAPKTRYATCARGARLRRPAGRATRRARRCGRRGSWRARSRVRRGGGAAARRRRALPGRRGPQR